MAPASSSCWPGGPVPHEGQFQASEGYLLLRVLARPRRWLRSRLPLPWRRRLAIAAGGAAGTGLRALIAVTLSTTGSWPWATFAENVSGSLLLGYLLTRFLTSAPRTTLTIPLLCTGLLGSYTTFSTFAVEIALLSDTVTPVVAVGYALASVAAGFIAAHLGVRVAERR
ncbi:MAG: fluoride efflux transporter CrcB [Nitriliruptorales bacterium]|nr:fluoride efflux transporter CrcB [Nitriliruptorales bacterium]